MDAQSGQQLMSQLDHVLNPSGRRTHQQLSRQFHALVRTFDLLAQRGQTGDAATTRDLRSAIDNLASALGVTVTRRHGSSGQTLGGGGPF
jgi:predicted DNA-binding ribbon-helix-helix protein